MNIRNVKIPWNTRLGDIGQSHIKAILSYFSNPTKYERDAGIDFYCELIEDDSPTDPFYVQAKSTQHFDSNWGCSISKSTIIYWLQQQHPVYLFVFDEENNKFYYLSIEDYRYELIQKIFLSDSNTMSIKFIKPNQLDRTKESKEKFIRKIKKDMINIQLFRGNPQFIGQGYAKKVPPRPRTKRELLQIKETVRASMYSLIQHYISQENSDTAFEYCTFLTRFDDKHFNHFMWHGAIAQNNGKKEIAKKSYEIALKICEKDKNWPKDSINKIKSAIEKAINDL